MYRTSLPSRTGTRVCSKTAGGSIFLISPATSRNVASVTSCPWILPLSVTPKRTLPPEPLSRAQRVVIADLSSPVVFLNSRRSDSPSATSCLSSSRSMGTLPHQGVLKVHEECRVFLNEVGDSRSNEECAIQEHGVRVFHVISRGDNRLPVLFRPEPTCLPGPTCAGDNSPGPR